MLRRRFSSSSTIQHPDPAERLAQYQHKNRFAEVDFHWSYAPWNYQIWLFGTVIRNVSKVTALGSRRDP
jgi:hypothetical protein